MSKTIKEIKKGIIIVAQIKDKVIGMAYLARGKFEKNKHVASLRPHHFKGLQMNRHRHSNNESPTRLGKKQ